MSIKNLTELRDRIARTLQARRLTEALNLLMTMASATSANWSVTDEIERLRKEYEYMSAYALDGVDDPSRKEVYASLVDRIKALADRMIRSAGSREASSLYFDTVRAAALRSDVTVEHLCGRLTKIANDIAMTAFTGKSEDIDLARERERLETELFRKVWVTHPLTRQDTEQLAAFLDSPSTPRHERLHLISALMLGAMEYFDPARLILLADIYMKHCGKPSSETAMRALVALLILLWVYRDRPLGSALTNRLKAAEETPRWHTDVKMVTLAMLRTRDTENITRTLNEEVIPSMLKLRPDIYNKLSNKLTDREGAEKMANPLEAMEENPEWQEMLERSGLNDKLRKLSEMQEQGADVMMASFSRLKSFPFFNEIANWFLPFYESHSLMAELRRSPGGDTAADMVGAAVFICDSDRFSMMMSITSLPEQHRRAMLSQFEAQNFNMAEIHSASLNPTEGQRERYAVNYIRDLYRFYRLFRRKGEFDGSFFDRFNPVDIPLLADLYADEDSLMLIGEFFFRHGYWADAIAVFGRAAALRAPEASLYQKMGYARQKLGELDKAAELYEKAEMLDPDNRWTWKRLAAVNRLLGHPERALPYYERLVEALPDDLNLTLQHANALAETGSYDKALKLYFKVEFLDHGSRRALRPIAWTAFLTGDYATSRKYFNRVLADEPNGPDFMNLGHLEMAEGHYREALEIYRHAIGSEGFSKAAFAKTMQEDLRHLRAAGVDDLVTGIVLDKLLS